MTMPLGTFCNKLNPKHPTKFTLAEIVRLKMILKELYGDLEFIMQIDFDEALKVILKKEY